jgi:hypothetical protein
MAVVPAAALVAVGALAADRYGLPILHSRALFHGSFAVVFPVYVLLFYGMFRPVVSNLATTHAVNCLRGRRVSKLAVWSLVLSGSGFVIPLLGSGLGIACGHMARRQCRERTRFYGSGIALAGLIVGYAGLAVVLSMAVILTWGYLSGQFI